MENESNNEPDEKPIEEFNEEQAKPGEFEAWFWIIGGIALAVFSILTFIYVHPEAPPPEGGGQFGETVRVVIRVGVFLCGCVLARNGFKLLKK